MAIGQKLEEARKRKEEKERVLAKKQIERRASDVREKQNKIRNIIEENRQRVAI